MRRGLGLSVRLVFVVALVSAASEGVLGRGGGGRGKGRVSDHVKGGDDQGLEGVPTVPRFSLQDDCNYTVIIETTCTEGAGTSDRVSIRFGDSNSNDILVRHLSIGDKERIEGQEPTILDDIEKPFQECATNAFNVTGKCIQSQICYLYLKHRGDDDWRIGSAQVFFSEAPKLSSPTFYFRRFLPRHVWHGIDVCKAEVTSFGVRRLRKVFGKKNNHLKMSYKH